MRGRYQGVASSGGSGDTVGPSSATDNAVARFDGTTGKLLQDSAVTVSDVSGASVTVATTAGNALAIAATAPAAAAGASQAGKAVSLAASVAVASTDTAGAAAGGSVTITAGAAARFTSGNADGGNINLVTGAGIGTGVAGQVVVPDGAAGAVGLRWSGAAAGTGWVGNGATQLEWHQNSAARFSFSNTRFAATNGGGIWNQAATATVPSLMPDIADTDTGIGRSGANLVSIVAGGVESVQCSATGVVMLIPKFAGTNSTGAGSALLGANSPASTLTAPYTWITVVSSDGSTGYMPIWK